MRVQHTPSSTNPFQLNFVFCSRKDKISQTFPDVRNRDLPSSFKYDARFNPGRLIWTAEPYLSCRWPTTEVEGCFEISMKARC
ncbi:hypothetical protein CEXT_613341 [Caerostris extrusa]|uniref:Uncharacterized protein n=1 Tax=Caerostris extrusa TaxID=172846 RepID=A0AAV4P4N8_CAEEX|nr:hypothetical protein CEXT_613341 [Caerostris extrusa]